MVESRLTRYLLRIGRRATLAFIYVPLFVIGLYAFNESVTQDWPIENFSTKWFSVALDDADVRDALSSRSSPALGATAIALVLGMLASIAVSRYRFFGREVVSFAVILPIALPGIVTGLALLATIIDVLGPLGRRVRTRDDHRRPCDVLHRRHLQQRHRPAAAHRRARSTKPRPTSAPTPGRRSAT